MPMVAIIIMVALKLMMMVVDFSDSDDDVNDSLDGHKYDDFRDSIKNWFKNKQNNIVKFSLPVSRNRRNSLL